MRRPGVQPLPVLVDAGHVDHTEEPPRHRLTLAARPRTRAHGTHSGDLDSPASSDDGQADGDRERSSR